MSSLSTRLTEAAEGVCPSPMCALLREAAQENTNLHKANVTLNRLVEEARQERDALRAAAEPFAHPDMGGQNEYGAWIGWQGLSKEGRIQRIKDLRRALLSEPQEAKP